MAAPKKEVTRRRKPRQRAKVVQNPTHNVTSDSDSDVAAIFVDPGVTQVPPSENLPVPFDVYSDWGIDLSSDEGLKAFDDRDDCVEEGEELSTRLNQGRPDTAAPGTRENLLENPSLPRDEDVLAQSDREEDTEGIPGDSEQ